MSVLALSVNYFRDNVQSTSLNQKHREKQLTWKSIFGLNVDSKEQSVKAQETKLSRCCSVLH